MVSSRFDLILFNRSTFCIDEFFKQCIKGQINRFEFLLQGYSLRALIMTSVSLCFFSVFSQCLFADYMLGLLTYQYWLDEEIYIPHRDLYLKWYTVLEI